MSVSAGAGDREPRIRSPTNEEKKNPIHHLHDITITTRTVPAITRPDVDPSRNPWDPSNKGRVKPSAQNRRLRSSSNRTLQAAPRDCIYCSPEQLRVPHSGGQEHVDAWPR
ncbi:hypothetical protein SLA2020_429710 [Shorea laevis]